MSLQVFACPECTQPFQVDSSQAGQKVRCPNCSCVTEIPTSDHSPAVHQPPSEQPPSEQPPSEQPPSEQPQPFRCPSCSNVFGVLESMFGSTMACPHCQQAVIIGASTTAEEPPPTPPPQQRPTKQQTTKQQTTKQPVAKRKRSSLQQGPPRSSPSDQPSMQHAAADDTPVIDPTSIAPEGQPEENEDLSEGSPSETRAVGVFQPQPVSHLLPPKFEAIDPAFFYRVNRNGDQVLLPTADGSVKAVSNRIVTIVHNGQEYQLISSPRYRAIQNVVVNALLLFIAAVLLLAIYWTVTS